MHHFPNTVQSIGNNIIHIYILKVLSAPKARVLVIALRARCSMFYTYEYTFH